MFFLCVVCRGFAVRSSHPFIVFYTFLTSAVHGNEPYDILPCISFSKIKKSCPAFYYYTKYMSMSSFSRWGQIFSLWLAAFHHFFFFFSSTWTTWRRRSERQRQSELLEK
jgi:hypothetical protein